MPDLVEKLAYRPGAEDFYNLVSIAFDTFLLTLKQDFRLVLVLLKISYRLQSERTILV